MRKNTRKKRRGANCGDKNKYFDIEIGSRGRNIKKGSLKNKKSFRKHGDNSQTTIALKEGISSGEISTLLDLESSRRCKDKRAVKRKEK